MLTHYSSILFLIIFLTGSLLTPATLSAVNRPGPFQELQELKDKRVKVVVKDKVLRRAQIRGNILRLTKDSIYLINYSSGNQAAELGYEKPLAIPFSRVKKVKLHNYRGKERKRRYWTIFGAVLTFISFFSFLSGDKKQRSMQGDYQSGAFWIGIYGMLIFGILAIINIFGWLRNIKTIPIDDTLTTAQFAIMQSYVL